MTEDKPNSTLAPTGTSTFVKESRGGKDARRTPSQSGSGVGGGIGGEGGSGVWIPGVGELMIGGRVGVGVAGGGAVMLWHSPIFYRQENAQVKL